MIEYKRKYSILHLTEQGIFHEGQLPSDYTGPVMDIEVVHKILFVNELTGELFTMTFNPPQAKNSGKSVAPYSSSDIHTREATVNEDHTDGTHYFPQAIKTKADFFIKSIESDGESKAI